MGPTPRTPNHETGDVRILGLGDLILDHIFARQGLADLRYCGSRGGGTIGNVLANAAAAGVASQVVGAVGGDTWGEATRAELAGYGVDVRHVATLPRKRTRVIFQLITSAREQSASSVSHVFTNRCPVCKRGQDSRSIARASKRELAPALRLRPGAVLVDTLGKDRIELAGTYRQRGVLSVLDVGRSAYLRRQPIDSIATALGSFDILFAPREVVQEIGRRLGSESAAELSSDRDLAVVASDGDRGLAVFSPDGQGAQLPAPFGARVRDSSGAGDALLARLLTRLTLSGQGARSRRLVQALAGALSALPPVLDAVGARGHLPRPESFPEPFPTLIGKTNMQIWDLIREGPRCPFCDSPIAESHQPPERRKSRPGAKANLALLSKRVFFASERKHAIAQCRELLDTRGTAFVVGTGGSFPVAHFVATALNTEGQLFAQAVRPFDYIRTSRPTDVVIVISYSGTTPDCGEVIDLAKRIGVARIALLTAASRPALASRLSPTDMLVSYAGRVSKGTSRLEGGFVSIAGTVSPCAIWTAAVVGQKAIATFAGAFARPDLAAAAAIETVASAASSGDGLLAFGGGYATAAMLDIESKFAEANLGQVVLHESKDFSHGRFISALAKNRGRSPAAIVLSAGPLHAYERELVDALTGVLDVEVLQSEHVELLGSLELLMRVQQLVYRTGDIVGRDISRPRAIPSEGLRLYRWREGLTRN